MPSWTKIVKGHYTTKLCEIYNVKHEEKYDNHIDLTVLTYWDTGNESIIKSQIHLHRSIYCIALCRIYQSVSKKIGNNSKQCA